MSTGPGNMKKSKNTKKIPKIVLNDLFMKIQISARSDKYFGSYATF